MKAKNISLILISLLLYITDASAQTRFYSTPRTFHESGFTYVSDLMVETVILHNRDHRWINAPFNYRDGTPIGFPTPPDVEEDNWTRQLSRSIVRNAFTPAEMQRLRGSRLNVAMYIDSNTGRVVDVEFRFSVREGFATIPVSVYRRIELELRERIHFVPTAEGRRRNFIFRNFNFEP